jgi:hypothetical protein
VTPEEPIAEDPADKPAPGAVTTMTRPAAAG